MKRKLLVALVAIEVGVGIISMVSCFFGSTSALETEIPETEAHETEVHEAEAHETEVPDTEAHETEVHEAEAHETEVPDTEAPTTVDPYSLVVSVPAESPRYHNELYYSNILIRYSDNVSLDIINRIAALIDELPETVLVSEIFLDTMQDIDMGCPAYCGPYAYLDGAIFIVDCGETIASLERYFYHEMGHILYDAYLCEFPEGITWECRSEPSDQYEDFAQVYESLHVVDFLDEPWPTNVATIQEMIEKLGIS